MCVYVAGPYRQQVRSNYIKNNPNQPLCLSISQANALKAFEEGEIVSVMQADGSVRYRDVVQQYQESGQIEHQRRLQGT